jgi:hypothetical protein
MQRGGLPVSSQQHTNRKWRVVLHSLKPFSHAAAPDFACILHADALHCWACARLGFPSPYQRDTSSSLCTSRKSAALAGLTGSSRNCLVNREPPTPGGGRSSTRQSVPRRRGARIIR